MRYAGNYWWDMLEIIGGICWELLVGYSGNYRWDMLILYVEYADIIGRIYWCFGWDMLVLYVGYAGTVCGIL